MRPYWMLLALVTAAEAAVLHKRVDITPLPDCIKTCMRQEPSFDIVHKKAKHICGMTLSGKYEKWLVKKINPCTDKACPGDNDSPQWLSTPGITICADTRRSLEELLLTRGRIHQCLDKKNDLRESKSLKVMEIESDDESDLQIFAQTSPVFLQPRHTSSRITHQPLEINMSGIIASSARAPRATTGAPIANWLPSPRVDRTTRKRWFLVFMWYLLPLSMATYFGLHIWLAIYHYAWRHMLWACFNPDKQGTDYNVYKCNRRGAAAILSIEGIMHLVTVIPWYYCLLVSHFRARWFTKTPIFDGVKSFYQIDYETGDWRICTKCPGGPHMGTRWYHCSKMRMNLCLPLYDHTCAWVSAAIYLHNIKAYVLAITTLPIHFMVTFGFCIYGLTHHPRDIFTAPLVILLILSSVLAIPMALDVTYRVWHEVIFRNRLGPENYGIACRIYFDDENDMLYFHRDWPEVDPKKFHTPADSAFNRGKKENMRSLLGWNGSWWKLPFWMFLTPPVGKLLFSEQDHARLWAPVVTIERDQMATAWDLAEAAAQNAPEIAPEAEPEAQGLLQHTTPQSTRSVAVDSLPPSVSSALRRRDAGAGGHLDPSELV